MFAIVLLSLREINYLYSYIRKFTFDPYNVLLAISTNIPVSRAACDGFCDPGSHIRVSTI